MGARTVPVIITFLILLAIFALMWWGWRNRLRRQADVAELPGVPNDVGPSALSVGGQYVTTTSAGDWLDRIAVHGLGIRTNATLEVRDAGVLLLRRGAPDIFIATAALEEITTQAGMAGKFVERDGLVVITWRLGERLVDTGFRTTEATAKKPLLQALQALVPAGAPSPETAEADTAPHTETAQTELPDADISRKNDENE
ncbi:PH-like domain-containing protein [Arthrobacter livingstonensis]|uniref:PH-like domain-containing protein n=1 Tax=Arthrobacter livingstonensis TaxID=670078 RepID=UPI001FE4923D|nr:hypothetical protein [Arthrobacter livingstonensis]